MLASSREASAVWCKGSIVWQQITAAAASCCSTGSLKGCQCSCISMLSVCHRCRLGHYMQQHAMRPARRLLAAITSYAGIPLNDHAVLPNNPLACCLSKHLYSSDHNSQMTSSTSSLTCFPAFASLPCGSPIFTLCTSNPFSYRFTPFLLDTAWAAVEAAGEQTQVPTIDHL